MENSENLLILNREIVSAVIISADGRILMGRKKSSSGVYSDSWHIPGGGTEGQDLIEALKREVFEEAGLDISSANIELLDNEGTGASVKVREGVKYWCEMKFNVYLVRLSKRSDEIKLEDTDDLGELTWFGREKFPEGNVTQPMKEMLERLKKRQINIFIN